MRSRERSNDRTPTVATKIVGYVRVSTCQQVDEGVSLDAQRARLRAYCAALDLDLRDIIADEGLSFRRVGAALEGQGLVTPKGLRQWSSSAVAILLGYQRG